MEDADDAGHEFGVGGVKHVTEPNDGDLGADDAERYVEADVSGQGDEEPFELVVRDWIVSAFQKKALGRNWTHDDVPLMSLVMS